MNVARTGSKSMEVVSWTSALSQEQTRASCFLMAQVPKHCLKTKGLGQTWPDVRRKLIWSLTALRAGTWPAKHWSGKPWPIGSKEALQAGTLLAGGFKGQVVATKEDLEWMASHFGLNSLGTLKPCCLCEANKADQDMPYTDCNAKATWMSSIFSNLSWKQYRQRQNLVIHPLLDEAILDNAGIEQFMPDWMHTKHLGVDAYLLASCISWSTSTFQTLWRTT